MPIDEKTFARSIVEYLEVDDDEFEQNLVKDLENFGKQKKIAGAKSLARLVQKTLMTQQRYFQTRSDTSLKESKKLEQQLTRAVEAVLNQ